MKRIRKLQCCIGIVLFCVIGIVYKGTYISLAESKDDADKRWYAYVKGEIPEVSICEGESKEITLEVTANYTLLVDKIKVCTQETPFGLKGTPKLYKKGGSEEVHTIGPENYELKFTLYGKKSTLDKTYNIVLWLLVGDNPDNLQKIELLDGVPVTYQTKEEDTSKGSVVVSHIKCAKELRQEEEAEISYSLRNVGDGKAYDITITYCGFEDGGIIPNARGITKKISYLEADKTKELSYPIQAAKNATAGSKKLGIMVTYKRRKNDTEYKTETENFFVEVIVEKKVKEEKIKVPKIKISNVKQSVEEPEAGKSFELSFTVENIGQKDAKTISITPINLTNRTFTPLDTETSIFIDELNVGQKKTVKLHYQISERIEGGLSSIDYSIMMKDKRGAEYSSSASVYVKNIKVKVENEIEGVPKLIIDKYSTGISKIEAGDEFMLELDIGNTHKSLGVNNIRVSIEAEEEDALTVAEGNNSFYIDSIKAGKSAHVKVPIKVNANCTAKSYPLKIGFEYEYKGLVYTKDTTATGLVTSEILFIKIEEDSRPSITHIVPGAYGDLICGEYNGLTFEFNNRGKTALYNVQVRIKGDFRSTQKVYYIGTVPEGARASHEIEITPLVEGTATGKMIVTYEDSDGGKNKIEHKFSGNVISSKPNFVEESIQPSMSANEETKTVSVKRTLKVVILVSFEAVLFLVTTAVVYRITYINYRKREKKED